MREVELKPCPFCGGSAKYVVSEHMNGDTSQAHRIVCADFLNCGAEIRTYISQYSPSYENEKEELINRWNRRVSNDE